ncbi:hypothetical protein S4A8_17836, partial [Salinisphaera sp. S4-8]|uniref:hypothetical protein n=1 Tax=Salinisphaera sp. S4-8 TaxID=633357 RepID=UPI0033409069
MKTNAGPAEGIGRGRVLGQVGSVGKQDQPMPGRGFVVGDKMKGSSHITGKCVSDLEEEVGAV